MKFVKAYIASSAHLCHPSFNPQTVYVAFDESDAGEVPEPPKAVETDPIAAKMAELQAQLDALKAGK